MCNPYNVNQFADHVAELLQSLDLRFSRMANRPSFQFAVNTKNTTFSCWVDLVQTRPWLGLYVFVQCRVPEDKRPAMAELLTRANVGSAWAISR